MKIEPRRRHVKTIAKRKPKRRNVPALKPWAMNGGTKRGKVIYRAGCLPAVAKSTAPAGEWPKFPWLRLGPAGETLGGCWVAVIARYRQEAQGRKGPSGDRRMTIRRIMEEEGVPDVQSKIRSRYFFQLLRKLKAWEESQCEALRWSDGRKMRKR
jgi:hypothetical protein